MPSGKKRMEMCILISSNDIEQTANIYKLNAFNKALIKINKPNLSNLESLN